MKENQIEDRKAVPVIGMVSSGKSTFLNSLLGIDVLEAKDNITTKFVCIIRYNADLLLPKFYHVILKENQESNDYNYYKDGEEAKGIENIKKMISSINTDNKETDSEPNYINLFYVLETPIKNIENKQFLSKYDFYDIPGLNEFIKEQKTESENIINETKNLDEKKKENDEDDDDEEKPDNLSEAPVEKTIKVTKGFDDDINNAPREDMKYIRGLFQYFKNKIDFGILIIDTERHYKPQNIQIIEELHKIIEMKFENFLFVLNKIDKSENREEAKSKCRSFFINSIDSSVFNIENNVFVAIDSLQLKNEFLLKSDFESYFKYYFNKYYEKYVATKTPNSSSKEEEINSYSFIDFLNEKMTENVKEEPQEYLEKLAENVSKKELKIVETIYEKIKNSQNQQIDFGIDFNPEENEEEEEHESIISLKAFYENFKKKIMIPEYSEGVKQILLFFNEFSNKNEITPNNEENIKKKTEEEEAITQFRIIFEGLKKYEIKNGENENENIIELLGLDLKRLEKIIYNQRRIYIPFIGISSAGKSTILNCIVGHYIFPESKVECTTRGIIVQHNFEEKTELYETDIDPSCDYYIFKERHLRPICVGNNVVNYLKSLNNVYSNNEKKHFFILKTPIKLFDTLGLPNDIKERISFIDLPGGDTDKNAMNQCVNGGEETVYQKLIHISTSFCFVNKGRSIELNENAFLLNRLYNKSKMYNKSDYSSKSQILSEQEFLKNCLFIINDFGNLTKEEKDISKIQNDIGNILYPSQQNKEMNNYINATIFNAKKYSSFLDIKNQYTDLSNLFCSLYIEFNNQQKDRVKLKFKKDNNYIKFCFNKIKERISQTLTIDDKSPSDDEFFNNVNKYINTYMAYLGIKAEKKDNLYIRKISNILFNFKKNLKSIKFYEESNCEQFFAYIHSQILNSDILLKKKYYEYLNESFKYLDKFFNQDFSEKKVIKSEDLNRLKNDVEGIFEDIFKKYEFEGLFQLTKNQIKDLLNKKKKESQKIMIDYNNNVQKAVESITPEIEEKLKVFKEKIENMILKLNDEIEGQKKLIKEVLQKSVENYEKIEVQSDFKYNEVNNSFLETLYNNLGIVNTALAGGIGAGIMIGILGLGIIPGVGTVISAVGALSMVVIGFLAGPSREKKFKKTIDKIKKNIADGFDDQSWNLMHTIKRLKKNLIESFKREIGICSFQLNKEEQKDFEEKKAHYFRIKEILFLTPKN